MSTQHAHYVFLFLVLAVNSNRFQELCALVQVMADRSNSFLLSPLQIATAGFVTEEKAQEVEQSAANLLQVESHRVQSFSWGKCTVPLTNINSE